MIYFTGIGIIFILFSLWYIVRQTEKATKGVENAKQSKKVLDSVALAKSISDDIDAGNVKLYKLRRDK